MKTALAGLGTLLGIVVVVAGFISYAGLPPYMTVKDHTDDIRTLDIQIAGGAAQFYEYRQSLKRREISQLERQKRQMLETPKGKAEWFKYYQKDLDRAKEESKKNEKELLKHEKRLEPLR